MAEIWLRELGGPEFTVFSAGKAPTSIDPLAAATLQDSGIDISGQSSDSVARYVDEHFDLVVTVCDHKKESCQHFPGATHSATGYSMIPPTQGEMKKNEWLCSDVSGMGFAPGSHGILKGARRRRSSGK